jgi:multifunctional beta-oxidation protein
MSDLDWELVHKVHVRGSYKCTKAAWPHMLNQGYGRIINTASAAGIYGNFGQANYSAAKMALHGFTMTIAREGAKKNVFCNTIAPLAASRMTESIMPPDMLAMLKPDFVMPLVAFLTHDSCTENGSLFEVGAGWIGKLRRERSKGAVFKADSTFTPGAVAAKWNQIVDFSGASHPSSIMDTDWMSLLEQAKALSSNPSKNLRYDGKVAVITGAGGGLGREYALLLAKLGASVVVNDLGGSTSGQGSNSSAADKVVNEIKAFGGKAVANYDSVEKGDKIIATAMDAFGRVDILINNAGILRDKSFSKMSDSDWDLVQLVHLHGTFKVTKAAWEIMLKQKYGRIINTASAVGLYGNFGQANYSTAKAALIGLSNTLALEGRKSNILVNTIAPNAGTRMTATIMPPEMVEAFKPEYVAPLVAFMSHESFPESGSVFECGCGWIAKVRWQRTGGVGFPVNVPLLPEHIASRFAEISTFDDGRATYPLTTQDSFAAVQSNFDNVTASNKQKKSSGNTTVNVEKARATQFKESSLEYTTKDVILYALGVGAKREELSYVYENSDKFCVLPTFAVIATYNYAFDFDFLPNFNPMMLLHGEQYLELHRPLATSGKLSLHGKVIDVQDKVKGASVVLGITMKDQKGQIVAESESTLFVRGSGGFGGLPAVARKPAAVATNAPPSRKPDAVIREKTSPELAALYRLSGDYNPLHLDPEMSKMGGFDIPILHGLCFYGIAAKHVLKAFCNNDPTKFKSIKARFAKHVLPGDTLETQMWKEGSKIIFVMKDVERDEIVISHAAVELTESAKPVPTNPSSSVAGFQASKIFESLAGSLNSLPEASRKQQVSKINAVFAFDINNDGKTASWYIDFKNGLGIIAAGKPSKADMTVIVSDKDFLDLALGKSNAQKAFMAGKIKVKGNVGLAT